MFRPDSPFVAFLTHVFNFVVVNLLFALCCIPIVSIGAAWSALYHSISNLIDDSSTSIGVFVDTFRSKFKIASKLWIPCAILFFMVITEVLFISNAYGSAIALPGGGVIQALLLILCIAIFSVLSYAFPIIGMNDISLKQALSISFYFAASNPITTILMTILNAAPIALFFLFPEFAAVLLPVWVLFAFSTVTWIDCVLLKKILKKYNPKN